MTLRDHPTSLALASLRDGSLDPSLRQHLRGCAACRVRAARLQRSAAVDDPSRASIRRILSASSSGPPVLADILAADPAPKPGQVWRVGHEEAVLVWVQHVTGDAVDAIPVVLDVELADQHTVLLPREASPLAVELALMTDLRGRVDRRAFRQRVADLDVSDEIAEVLAAVREGREPDGVAVGPPIDVRGDQRLEYRHVIADLMADLAPGLPGPSEGRWREPDVTELIALLSRELPARHPGIRVRAIESQPFTLDERRELRCCARVSYLDSSVIVAVLAGSDVELPDAADLAPACWAILRSEPATDAVAVTVMRGERPTVVLEAPDMRVAYEPPGGEPRGPRFVSEPLAIVDALAKHFDRQASAWEITEPIESVLGDVDVAAQVARHARAATTRLSAEGKRAVTPAKKAAWTNLPADFAAEITEAVVAISGSAALDAVLGRLIRRDDA